MDTAQKKVPRAKALIHDAFLSLMEEKGFNSVKVVDIIERADVSRTTFYFHYTDKYALMDELRSEVIESFLAVMLKIRCIGMEAIMRYDDTQKSPYRQYFEHVRANERVWRLFLSGRGESDFSKHLSDRIRQHIELTLRSDKITFLAADPGISIEIAANIGAWTTVGLLSQWVLGGMSETPEEMGRVLSIFWKRFCT